MPGRIVLATTADGASSPTERMRIRSDGRLFYGTTSALADGRICLKGDFGTNRGVVIESNQSSADMVRFDTSSGHAGTIISSGTSTTYATSSDYRLKENVVPENNPVYQGIDQSKLVPLLTAALQEAIGRIETLEAEVSALKGA
jgi:hypothetical protein